MAFLFSAADLCLRPKFWLTHSFIEIQMCAELIAGFVGVIEVIK